VKERAMAEPWDVTDKMLAYLIERADALAAHAANPRAEAELERLVALIEAYETKRWPNGKMAGGEG
jgi:hypothetical protein